MEIDLILVTYNRLDFTKRTLSSILADPTEEFRLTIWDNNSEDGTAEFLKNEVDDPRIADIVLSKENKGQAPATNEIWSKSKADLIGKLDNDCILTPGWTRTIAAAHRDVEELGAVACWHFFEDDFDEQRAAHKIQQFGTHRIFRHPWICGTGFLMKRSTYERAGHVESKAFTQYWIKLAQMGYVNGFYYPLIYQEHMDDPKSEYCEIVDDESFEKAKSITVGLSSGRYSSVEGRLKSRNKMVDNLLDDPFEVSYYTGWRRKVRGVRDRLQRMLGRST
ncbi:MAG: glycosyltransferase [Planctomycetota bacterium]